MQASLKAERQRLKSEHMKIMKTLDEEFRAAYQVYKIITKLWKQMRRLTKYHWRSAVVPFGLNTIRITKPSWIFDANFSAEDIFILNQNIKYFKNMIQAEAICPQFQYQPILLPPPTQLPVSVAEELPESRNQKLKNSRTRKLKHSRTQFFLVEI